MAGFISPDVGWGHGAPDADHARRPPVRAPARRGRAHRRLHRRAHPPCRGRPLRRRADARGEAAHPRRDLRRPGTVTYVVDTRLLADHLRALPEATAAFEGALRSGRRVAGSVLTRIELR